MTKVRPLKNTPGVMKDGEKVDGWWKKVTRWMGMGRGNATQIRTEDLTSRDVVIALMGLTGTGKSTFIETICGVGGRAGHSLASCTQEISAFRLTFPEHQEFSMCFVDTPGFDDTEIPYFVTFGKISEWMIKTYKRHIPLSGVLYFHRISDNRMGQTQVMNLGHFAKLCGEDSQIVLVTTMWDSVDEVTGSQRERELIEVFWRSMIVERCSSVRRFFRTRHSALDVLGPIFDKIREQSPRPRSEVADPGLQMSQTTDRRKRVVENGTPYLSHIAGSSTGNADTRSITPPAPQAQGSANARTHRTTHPRVGSGQSGSRSQQPRFKPS